MFRAIRRVLDEHPDCRAVYPIHLNPVVREAANAELGGCDQIHMTASNLSLMFSERARV
jgi:UDP-N-acetylglucosamine 2-epimerase (non-hydrolysing)